jgi:type I restriction enzyme M protein
MGGNRFYLWIGQHETGRYSKAHKHASAAVLICVKGKGYTYTWPETLGLTPWQVLRLPTGIFYANGVKANVLFLDNREANPNPWTKDVWYYDYRTNVHHTLKKKTMRFDDLADFIKCYNPANRHKRKETWSATSNPEGRWRKFSYEELKARDKASLDVFWLRDKSLTDLDNLPDPDVLADEIIENLEAGLNSFRVVLAGLNKVAQLNENKL